MGLHLTLLAIDWFDPQTWLIFLQVAFGLGAVIFVHELGHFAVAKMCGVKCEKFYIGFDINGWKICKFQWGETEYGIGVLPLGGYVKMLGQEDNPARVAEEMERAKVRQESGSAAEPGEQPYALDPRSYMAQSVPKRMAIISAGVVMNIIFAFIFASIAYGMGVNYSPCIVGSLFPGEAAWEAGLLPGDKVVQIGDIDKPRFQDLQQQVALGDIEHGIPLLVKRPGVEELLSIVVMPERKEDGYAPRIGMTNPATTTLRKKEPVFPFTPAAAAEPEFQGGDTIVAIDGQPVETYADLHGIMAQHASEALTFTVQRASRKKSAQGSAEPARGEAENTAAGGETLDIEVAPNPLRVLGLTMELGPITAVQPNSPAAKAGIQPGDQLLSIDNQPPGNPATLPERLRSRAGETVSIELSRPDHEEPVVVEAELRNPPWYELSIAEGSPMSAPALGIAYRINNVVAEVEPESPAGKAGLKAGDEVVKAVVTQPAELKVDDLRLAAATLEIEFSEAKPNWPAFFTYFLQEVAPDSKIELTLKDGRTVSMKAIDSEEFYVPGRGFGLEALMVSHQADSLAEAVSLGLDETVDSLTLVVRFLRKIGTQVSPMAMGGPGTIFAAAGSSAKQGFSQLLIFLCMLSANLAVINFLPIPVLDGGHMVFLAVEGIRGKPVSERVFMAFTYAGFLFILTLMLFVIGLDVSRFFSWL